MTLCSFRLFKIKMGAAVLNSHENRNSFKLSTARWIKEHVLRLPEVKGESDQWWEVVTLNVNIYI